MTAKTGKRVVLDSFAVLALLQGQPAAQHVADVLSDGEPWMTLVNLGEVTYIVERTHGKAAADDIFANLLAEERPGGGAPLRWLPIDERLVRRAASLKAAGSLSYADCFAAAAAAMLGCPVLTGDPEFVAAERAGITVTWLQEGV
ncbi:MAG TPA: type II toxin-antitoxin system VapC family toxin [Chloroflexota bacterium]|nr:type II toxin-antitoxin system VapC family toxin [Chloroflexota bacterium]